MHSLRQRIAFLMGMSSLFALLAGGVLTVLHYESKVRKQSSLELASISRNTPAMIDAVGTGLSTLGRTLSMAAEIQEPLETGQYHQACGFLARFLEINNLDFVEITDSSSIIFIQLADSSRRGQPSTNPLVQIALRGNPHGHGIFRQKDQSFIVATLPVVYENKLLGTITVGKTFDRSLLQRLGSFPGVDLAIWNRTDEEAIVPPGRDPLPPISKILSEEELASLISGKTILKNIKFQGNVLQGAFFTLKELGGGSVGFYASYRSMKYLQEAGWLTFIHLTALFFLVLILVGYFAIWISKRVTKPLVELTSLSSRLADMNFNEQVPVRGNDEIAELARSFNNLSRALNNNIAKKDQYAAELGRLNEELEILVAKRTEELEHSNTRLQREIAEKNDFLRTVSHDLGAPLRNIGGLTRMLEKKFGERLGGEGLDRLERIQRNVDNELDMIEQLLELSRLKTRRQKMQVIDLMDLLAQIRQDFSCSLEEKNIRFVVEDVLPSIWGEKDRFRRLFQNLVDNAIKYMGIQSEPEIMVGWSQDPDFHLFWIKDNGMGVPDDQKEKIFGVFQRVKSREVSEVEGKGVGLASVKTIVELYGGEIWVESPVGMGSTFYFTLNRALVDPARALDPEVQKEDIGDSLGSGQTETEDKLADDYA